MRRIIYVITALLIVSCAYKSTRIENKFVIIAVHGSKNRRRGGLQ